jgi:hypothetical protein
VFLKPLKELEWQMTKYTGQLYKMAGSYASPIEYRFVLKQGGAAIANLPSVNEFIGRNLTIEFTGKINCIACQRALKKTFQQGYCYPCAQKLASCDMCILKPENCHFHLGTCREPNWGLSNCFVPHIVYLANSSGIKVGVTRETQTPHRWIDQGAIQSIPIMRVQSRIQAGLIETAIAKTVADKTNWRKMLQGNNEKIDLAAKRNELFSAMAPTIQEIAAKFKFGQIELLTAEAVNEFNYPVLQYPQKITSLCFDKTSRISGTLHGIKGQYLIFDSGVINLRKYTGYEVTIE